MMILLSRPEFYDQGIRWCHSFLLVTLIFQGYDLCKVTVDSFFHPLYTNRKLVLVDITIVMSTHKQQHLVRATGYHRQRLMSSYLYN